MEHAWNATDRKKPKYTEKNLSQCHSVYTNSTTVWHGIGPAPSLWQKQITASVLPQPPYYNIIWLENLENINTEYVRFSWRYICILSWRCSVWYKFTGVSGKPLPPVRSPCTSVHLYQNTRGKTWWRCLQTRLRQPVSGPKLHHRTSANKARVLSITWVTSRL